MDPNDLNLAKLNFKTEVDSVQNHVADLGKSSEEHLGAINQIKDDISTAQADIKDNSKLHQLIEIKEAEMKAGIFELKVGQCFLKLDP